MFKYFDAHSHLNLKQFDEDREDQIKKLEELSIGTITVGVDFETSVQAVKIAENSKNIYACIGQHPTDTDEFFDFEKYKLLAENPKVVAIGECGLDYFRGATEEEKMKQKEIFQSQIKLALEADKPLMIHARPSQGTMNAYEEVLDILEGVLKDQPSLKGNFHFFVGDLAIAKRILAIGFTVSFDGPITFARDYDEVVKFLPLESILAETDAPFACPELVEGLAIDYEKKGISVPGRGKRNESSYVSEVVKKIALIRGEDFEQVRQALIQNTLRVFNIK